MKDLLKNYGCYGTVKNNFQKINIDLCSLYTRQQLPRDWGQFRDIINR